MRSRWRSNVVIVLLAIVLGIGAGSIVGTIGGPGPGVVAGQDNSSVAPVQSSTLGGASAQELIESTTIQTLQTTAASTPPTLSLSPAPTATPLATTETLEHLPASTELSAPPASTAIPPAAPAPSREQSTIRLEDADWSGGYRYQDGQSVYGGRTATWLYGTSTEYSRMEAIVEIGAQPVGSATLSVEGIDAEGEGKTPISVQINGVELYNGPNPLPDHSEPTSTAEWATHSWNFDAQLLQPGQNVISIMNLAQGARDRPPWFMLDYADITYTLP